LLKIISECPSCNSVLVRIKDQLFCKSSSCPSQGAKKIEKYAKQLKIKGLGPATITKLGLDCISDIYLMTHEYINDALGEKIGTKLKLEIDKSLTTSITDLLPAFSIRLIGRTAAAKVATIVTDIKDITPKACQEAGLGEKATANLVDWVNEEYEDLGYNLVASREAIKGHKGTVVITGKLDNGLSRRAATDMLQEHGYKVTTSVSKNTDYLILEDNSVSSKTTKAEALGIHKTTLQELLNV